MNRLHLVCALTAFAGVGCFNDDLKLEDLTVSESPCSSGTPSCRNYDIRFDMDSPRDFVDFDQMEVSGHGVTVKSKNNWWCSGAPWKHGSGARAQHIALRLDGAQTPIFTISCTNSRTEVGGVRTEIQGEVHDVTVEGRYDEGRGLLPAGEINVSLSGDEEGAEVIRTWSADGSGDLN